MVNVFILLLTNDIPLENSDEFIQTKVGTRIDNLFILIMVILLCGG